LQNDLQSPFPRQKNACLVYPDVRSPVWDFMDHQCSEIHTAVYFLLEKCTRLWRFIYGTCNLCCIDAFLAVQTGQERVGFVDVQLLL
jgi:hypothetical protein